MRASFAIPGDLATPTGGYGYARRLLVELPDHGIDIRHVTLPGGFPFPDDAQVEEAGHTLANLPEGEPVLIDGLAGGALPADMLLKISGPAVMLCHHPLGMESGLSQAESQRLIENERNALAACDHVITTSHATARTLVQEFGITEGGITVALPGTEPAPRAPADGPCRILSVGSLSRRKRHHLLIDALAQHRDHEWTLRIAGPAVDESVHADLIAQIERLGLQDRVRLLGSLTSEEIATAYQNSDLFALASEYEGFGMAFTEAMSHGLPTVGTRCTAVEEATAGGAYLVDDDEFPSALGALIADPGQRGQWADRAWQTAQTFLRWEETAGIVAGALREAAE